MYCIIIAMLCASCTWRNKLQPALRALTLQ